MKNTSDEIGRHIIEHDNWNMLKKAIDRCGEETFFPKEGEVWMAYLGKNIGNEQNGTGDMFSRPLSIIKKFNNKMHWAIPLSTVQKEIDFYHNFTDYKNKKVSAILAQLKLISVKRLKRKMYTLPENEFTAIVLKIKNMLP